MLAIATALFVTRWVVQPVHFAVSDSLGLRVNAALRRRMVHAMLAPPGIAHLEDPAILDQASLGKGVGPAMYSPGVALTGLAQVVTWRLQVLGSAVLVARFHVGLALLLLASGLWQYRSLRREYLRNVVTLTKGTQRLRRSQWFRDLAVTPGATKELRVFGLAGWVEDRFAHHWLLAMADVWRDRARGRRIAFTVLSVSLVVDLIAYGSVARAAAHGAIGVGALVVLLQAIGATGGVMLSDAQLSLEYGLAALPALAHVEGATRAATPSANGARPARGLPVTGIRFDDIRFRYPGTTTAVLDGLSLELEAGRSLAIVGANGAGKTTLVKLLARLYEPDAGHIVVDGIALHDLDVTQWRRRVACLFQDFVHYELPARDNVGFGDVARAANRDAIIIAARSAGADGFVESLPAGYDTVLSRQYTGGTDLSGGEWQRIALARALMAVQGGAGVLVLDEPTANLDVRAEVELFDQFLELTRGLTTVLVSHRFSTVRRADRICVLARGRVIELGSHDELLARGGEYARLFRLQADRFTDDADAMGGADA
jgi:ATP-binding cassette subfamily B protein